MTPKIRLPRIAQIMIAAVVFSAASLAFAQEPASEAEARNQELWRAAIAQTEVPAEGCFQASYPSLEWSKVECVEAPNVAYGPRKGLPAETVGNGHDYAAEITSGLISQTVGSFPTVTGVTKETGVGGANSYSLQLNSNFMHTAACNRALIPAQCLAWLQYIYASDYDAVFMQYWLIYWDNPCPAGWNSDGSGDCYTNSAAVTAPQEVITKLSTLKLSGSAKKGGKDTDVFTVGTTAYSVSGNDSVVDLATAWKESEFNIIGDGGGSSADFNTGSHVTVKVQVTNGTTNAPKCAANAGTTGETNNLNLGKCTATGGSAPYIEFLESN